MTETTTHQGQCEYCDTEGPVTHFPRIALNVCADCYRVHREAIDRAEGGN